MFCSMPGFYPLDSRNTPQHENQKLLQMLPNTLGGEYVQNCSQLRTTGPDLHVPEIVTRLAAEVLGHVGKS